MNPQDIRYLDAAAWILGVAAVVVVILGLFL
jgi:hypothetical protein